MYKNIDFKKINGSNLQNKNNLQSDDFYNFFLSENTVILSEIVPRYPLYPEWY